MSKFSILILLALGFYSINNASANPEATISTSAGKFKVKLYEKYAPNTVANFIELSKAGFYKNKAFNQIIDDLYIQVGVPPNSEPSPSKYCLPNEFDKNIYHQKAGIVSMMRNGVDSNSHEFAIYLKKLPHLDGYQTAFGEIIEGLDIVKKISLAPRSGKAPEQPVKILNITITGETPKTDIIRFPVLTKVEIQKRFSKEFESLFTNIAEAQNLGKLEWYEIYHLRSKCSETQINLVMDFKEARNSKLLAFGSLSNDTFVIKQFQFKRGTAVDPNKKNPLFGKQL